MKYQDWHLTPLLPHSVLAEPFTQTYHKFENQLVFNVFNATVLITLTGIVENTNVKSVKLWHQDIHNMIVQRKTSYNMRMMDNKNITILMGLKMTTWLENPETICRNINRIFPFPYVRIFFYIFFCNYKRLTILSSSFHFPLSFIFIFTMSINSIVPINPSRILISQIPYPPPILTKHHIWYSDTDDLFITICGVLFGLHRAYFNHSQNFQTIMDTIKPGQLLHPIPFNDLDPLLFHWFLQFFLSHIKILWN